MKGELCPGQSVVGNLAIGIVRHCNVFALFLLHPFEHVAANE